MQYWLVQSHHVILVLNYNEDCDIEYCVKFKYDYNMEEKDVFAEQVRSVTLYAFDENNNLVYQNTDQGEQLGDSRLRYEYSRYRPISMSAESFGLD